MKKNLIIILVSLFAINTYAQIRVQNDGRIFFYSGWGQLVIDNSGYLGPITLHPESDWIGHLGTRYKRYGDIWAHHLIAYNVEEDSDERIKENISSVDSALTKIKKLDGVKYDIKESYFKNIPDTIVRQTLMDKRKNQTGFIAQDLQKVFPELVNAHGDSAHYTVRYTGLIPVLVEAIKEQQTQIETLQSIVYLQEKELIKIKKRLESLEAKESQESKNQNLKSGTIVNPEFENQSVQASLNQNFPNPFTEDTEIGFTIPESVNTAFLLIYNLNGNELDKIKIQNRGNDKLVIQGNKFKPGMYIYTLICDGIEVDSKRFILTSN